MKILFPLFCALIIFSIPRKSKLKMNFKSLLCIAMQLLVASAMADHGDNSVIEHKRFECEIYDEMNCTNFGDCNSRVEQCKIEAKKSTSCYVLWSTGVDSSEIKIKMKGCFTGLNECDQKDCVTSAKPRQQNIHFCCCQGSMCNTEHKWIPTSTETPPVLPTQQLQKFNDAHFLIIGTILFAILTLILAIVLQIYRKRKQRHFDETSMHDLETVNSSPSLSNRPIELLERKAIGRFGDVWLATLYNQHVAVKIFHMQEKDSWNSEIGIYQLPRMRHSNILEFLGYEKHLDKSEYWLLSAYQHNGSLYDYLRSHTITWKELCKIAQSMAVGLAHLHEEIPESKTVGFKPSIAHRDFKSKNVLLKSDLTACIADFGLAMVFEANKPCGDSPGQVGTRRYMAPEVLEGAINFDRDSFLRIDMYACGLVLWEMISRCDAVGPVPEFLLPFEAELGDRPSLDAIQENVVVKKLRPRIRNSWQSHPGLRLLCVTIEECWDHDAEARLTSSCVMERFMQYNSI